MPPVSRFYMQSVNSNVRKSKDIVCGGQLTLIQFVGRRINDAQGCSIRSLFACHWCHISRLALIKARQQGFSAVIGN